MARNTFLSNAKKNKKDEFYTQLVDIERELVHYREHFKDKVIFCNCDDPEESNFWWYFKLNFDFLGLKKLVTTHYDEENPTYKLVIDGTRRDKDGNPIEVKTQLKSNGDFRSEESIKVLKESDIVITNPPFSLFREYVAQLFEYDKKFIIVSNQNATTYREIFPLIQDNKMWYGYGFKGGAAHFINKHYIDYASASDRKEGMIRVSGVIWLTNLPHDKRYEDIILVKKYYGNEELYPKYDNYNAINVDKTKDIPEDYDGIMGVPITFLDKYSPKQFEIVGLAAGNTRASAPKEMLERVNYVQHSEDRGGCGVVDGKRKYARILIKHKRGVHNED